MSTSFGIQSAVMLHLVTQVVPDVPVIWVDTGYLPVETYRFAEDLTTSPEAQPAGVSVAHQPSSYGSPLRSPVGSAGCGSPQPLRPDPQGRTHATGSAMTWGQRPG
jgi:3'-phosphoadenosine 5'-phosphosulfate sulfotransferase (PAPS reductase)/FAD synthetase